MIKAFREQLGLSQEELAAYLRVSRSYLSMAELDHRDLPFTKMEPVYRFISILDGPASKKKPHTKLSNNLHLQQEKKMKDLEWETVKSRKQLSDLRVKLKTVKETQARCANILQRIDDLKDGASKNELDLVDHMERNVCKMQAATGEDTVFKLELQLYVLKAKLNFLKSVSI